ncbi:hypothetical protein L596_010775 [Steinernema carpocapsae]|uniref:Uncharacterized protein n=1 Tax=Steinernema carpocapsae TaxID=34508 RepID=A0A4U5PJA4_STECR|nr:hypothetical protein L596_010775 [Steinernema carpocapsae]
MARKHVFVALLFIAVLYRSLTDMVGKLVLVALFSTVALIGAVSLIDTAHHKFDFVLVRHPVSLEDLLLLLLPQTLSVAFLGQLDPGSIASAAKPADNSGNALDQTLTNLGLGNATPGLNTTLGGLGTLLNGLTTISVFFSTFLELFLVAVLGTMQFSTKG